MKNEQQKEFIEHEAVINHIDCVVNEAPNADYRKAAWGFGVFVSRLPTADVVHVVRCKDCKKHYKDGFCDVFDVRTKAKDYCSYGERKESYNGKD